MTPIDFGIAVEAGKALTDLYAFIQKKFGKRGPDAIAGHALVSQLQQHVDGLRSKVVELESAHLELKRKDDAREAWKALSAGLELIQSPGGAYVYARHGKPPYFCPVCYNKQAATPLQPRSNRGDCPGCKAIYEIAPYQKREIPVLQRRGVGGTALF